VVREFTQNVQELTEIVPEKSVVLCEPSLPIEDFILPPHLFLVRAQDLKHALPLVLADVRSKINRTEGLASCDFVCCSG